MELLQDHFIKASDAVDRVCRTRFQQEVENNLDCTPAKPTRMSRHGMERENSSTLSSFLTGRSQSQKAICLTASQCPDLNNSCLNLESEPSSVPLGNAYQLHYYLYTCVRDQAVRNCTSEELWHEPVYISHYIIQWFALNIADQLEFRHGTLLISLPLNGF